MLDDFFARALIGGVGVALAAGPLGCFVVWRRMAYFGETIAHNGLLGIALGFAIGIDLNAGILIVCVAAALLLLLLQNQRRLATDTLLGILAHSALSLGLIALSFMETVRVDLVGYLFGDILAITEREIVWIYVAGAAVLAVMALIWRPLLALTLHEDLARAEGARVALVRALYTLLIALAVAIAMKVVGIMLVISLLIIPAATARRLARSPEQMAALASLIGAGAVVAGLHGSLAWDTPSGPSIVVAALALFLVAFGAGAVRDLWPRAADSRR